MMLVTPKKVPVRHNGKRYAPGEEFEIARKDFEKIKSHLDVIDEEDKKTEDPELEKLRTRGKELGIKNYHNMGKDKLEAAIEEKEKEIEADKQLQSLREKAVTLGIEGADKMNAEALIAAIASAEGGGNGQ